MPIAKKEIIYFEESITNTKAESVELEITIETLFPDKSEKITKMWKDFIDQISDIFE